MDIRPSEELELRTKIYQYQRHNRLNFGSWFISNEEKQSTTRV